MKSEPSAEINGDNTRLNIVDSEIDRCNLKPVKRRGIKPVKRWGIKPVKRRGIKPVKRRGTPN